MLSTGQEAIMLQATALKVKVATPKVKVTIRGVASASEVAQVVAAVAAKMASATAPEELVLKAA